MGLALAGARRRHVLVALRAEIFVESLQTATQRSG